MSEDASALPKNYDPADVEGPTYQLWLDGGAFDASPGADELVYEEHFGFRWFHSATVVEVGVPVDDEGLLAGSLVEKVHEISYEPGSAVIALGSPDGETYVRIGRDAGRSTDDPTLPTGWEIVEIEVPDGYTTLLPDGTLDAVIDQSAGDEMQAAFASLARAAQGDGAAPPALAPRLILRENLP